MGLPAPLMSLFNLLQFGSIGEEEQTIEKKYYIIIYEGVFNLINDLGNCLKN